jgi:hypothetical protein
MICHGVGFGWLLINSLIYERTAQVSSSVENHRYGKGEKKDLRKNYSRCYTLTWLLYNDDVWTKSIDISKENYSQSLQSALDTWDDYWKHSHGRLPSGKTSQGDIYLLRHSTGLGFLVQKQYQNGIHACILILWGDNIEIFKMLVLNALDLMRMKHSMQCGIHPERGRLLQDVQFK